MTSNRFIAGTRITWGARIENFEVVKVDLHDSLYLLVPIGDHVPTEAPHPFHRGAQEPTPIDEVDGDRPAYWSERREMWVTPGQDSDDWWKAAAALATKPSPPPQQEYTPNLGGKFSPRVATQTIRAICESQIQCLRDDQWDEPEFMAHFEGIIRHCDLMQRVTPTLRGARRPVRVGSDEGDLS